MAYALIAGVDPRYGLYSAIVVTAVASLLGSSSHLINGPTNAISLVVFSALAFLDPDARQDAYEAMFLLGIMVGAIQIGIAVFRLGDLTRYISESVVHGFLTGAGLLIALGQVGNILGLTERGNGHQTVVHRFWLTLSSGAPVNPGPPSSGSGPSPSSLARVASSFGITFHGWISSWPLLSPLALPRPSGGPRVAPTGSLCSQRLDASPRALPAPHVPNIQLTWFAELSSSAVAIAILGLLEALSISKAIATRTRQVLDYNKQCLAEGLANLAGGFFQCLPGSGSLTRSAINYQAGAVSRLSGVVAAAVVALVVVFFAPFARFIPKAALAALLIVTAVRLVDWERLRQTLRGTGYDATLVVVTALTAAFVSVEWSDSHGGRSLHSSVRFASHAASRVRARARPRPGHPTAPPIGYPVLLRDHLRHRRQSLFWGRARARPAPRFCACQGDEGPGGGLASPEDTEC